jgi:hypothetical protein
MKSVDEILEQEMGMPSMHLPDFLWRDHYDDGISAKETANEYLIDGYWR